MSKKPADQSSEHTDADADVEIDLEADADTDLDGDDADGDDEDGEGDGADIATVVATAVRKALEAQTATFTSEMDRRINSALGGQRKQKPPAGDSSKDDSMNTSDVRGARLAFREYLPTEMKFLSPEERKMATEYGINLIKVAAAEGFDDEDTAGRKAAEETAKFFKTSRSFYAGRTKKALEKQGALKDQNNGQAGGGLGLTTDTANAHANAASRRERMFGQIPQK